MARPRSLVAKMEMTTAGRAHDCRSNRRHRLEKGDRRLTVWSDGRPHHYCLVCGEDFLVRGIGRLRELMAEVGSFRRRCVH